MHSGASRVNYSKQLNQLGSYGSPTITKGNTMQRETYVKDKVEYVIQNSLYYDEVTPYWVYYNSKLVSKFTDKETAKTYIKVLMRN